MSLISSLSISDFIIIAFAIALLAAVIRIFQLQKKVKEEKDKRLVPELMVEIDENGRGIYLINEGSCSAINIKIEDITFCLDYDFKKTLVFKFENVDVVHSGKKEVLKFAIYDKQYKVAAEEIDNILGRLSRDSFEMRLSFFNLENIKFSAVIKQENGRTFIKEIAPLHK